MLPIFVGGPLDDDDNDDDRLLGMLLASFFFQVFLRQAQPVTALATSQLFGCSRALANAICATLPFYFQRYKANPSLMHAQAAAAGSYSTQIRLSLANGHITLKIPVLVRSLKSSNVEPG